MNLDNPYRPSKATSPRSSLDSATGIRKLWAVFLAVIVVASFFWAYKFIAPGASLPRMSMMTLAVDLAGMFFLFRFVIRKPIRRMAIRLLVIFLALVMCLRAGVDLYLLAPYILPWAGEPEQYLMLSEIVVRVPTYLLFALALWRYATEPQR